MITPKDFLHDAKLNLAEMAIEVEGGNVCPLEFYVMAARLQKMLGEYAERFRAQAVAELSKHGKEARILGYTAKPKEAVTYEYAYPEHVAATLAEAKRAKEAYEKMAKAASVPFDAVGEGGELLYTVVPAIRKSTSTLTITEI